MVQEAQVSHDTGEEYDTASSPASSTSTSSYEGAPTGHAASPSPALQNGGSGGGSGKKLASLAHIAVPSFSAFRSQASSIPVPSPTRKGVPLQLMHSPRPVSYSHAEKASPRLIDLARPLSLSTSPLLPQSGELASATSSEGSSTRSDDSLYAAPARGLSVSVEPLRLASSDHDSPTTYTHSRPSSIPIHAKYASEQNVTHAPRQSVYSVDFDAYSSSPVKSESRDSMPPHTPSMTVQLDGVPRTISAESLLSQSPLPHEERPKSPAGRLGSLFRWKSSSQRSGTVSPTTTFSDRSLSPLPSPRVLPKPDVAAPMGSATPAARLTPAGLDIQKANSRGSGYYDNPDTPILFGSPETNAHVIELENELAQVSAELAGSIRREMDLEDELDRLKAEVPTFQHTEANRRSSDYFSDSDASSTRYPVPDLDAKLDQMEQKLRKVEQEKANFKVEMASRLQTELGRRRDLEQIIHGLESQLQEHLDGAEKRERAGDRIAELESSLDDTRRRLGRERQAKDTFGDLYSATRLELEQHKNERDNLEGEVVPQLRARVEGLEIEAAETQALVYENARMQQELVALREETQRLQSPGIRSTFRSIAEEGGLSSPVTGTKGGPSRSNSAARVGSSARGGSVTRSGSVKDRSEGGRQRSGSVGGHPLSTEGVKEIEDQRDALHQALKLLISRHEKQQRDHERAIRKLTSAKDRAELASPKRTTYHREVSVLKDEITRLRKRTEDALEQKWQYEKGLSGLKMDLDRAEQETGGLRILLEGHDFLPPSTRHSLSSTYDEANNDDEDAEANPQPTLSATETDRDRARHIAETYRHRALSAPSSALAEELQTSASRMEDLTNQLDTQLHSHLGLRARLSEAIAAGEQEQKVSTQAIEAMQLRLARSEEGVLAAQQYAEATLGAHEADVRGMEEAAARSPALRRLGAPGDGQGLLSPSSSVRGVMEGRAPKLPADTSLRDASRTQNLASQVRELEVALREAEEEMQGVVARVGRRLGVVAELQMERDAAVVQVRRLRGLMGGERERGVGVFMTEGE